MSNDSRETPTAQIPTIAQDSAGSLFLQGVARLPPLVLIGTLSVVGGAVGYAVTKSRKGAFAGAGIATSLFYFLPYVAIASLGVRK